MQLAQRNGAEIVGPIMADGMEESTNRATSSPVAAGVFLSELRASSWNRLTLMPGRQAADTHYRCNIKCFETKQVGEGEPPQTSPTIVLA